jgi:hypothetical protein
LLFAQGIWRQRLTIHHALVSFANLGSGRLIIVIEGAHAKQSYGNDALRVCTGIP